MKRIFLLSIIVGLIMYTPLHAEEKWYLSFYAGQSNHKKYIDYFKLASAPEDSYIFVVAGGKTIYRFNQNFTIDAEALVGQHSGKQSNQEFGFALILRSRFSISEDINIGLAIGDGPSYASTIPNIEKDNSETTARLLNLLLTEATVGFNKHKTDLFIRIHHRSGIFGLVSGVKKGGSNFLALGLRYYF